MNAHSPALLSYPLTVIKNDLGIPNSAEHHLSRQRHHTIHAHSQSIFRINANENGSPGNALHTIDKISLGYRSRVTEEFQILGLVEKGWITGPGGTKYGSSGIIVNCPPVFRFL